MRFADQRARFNRRFFNHVALPLSGKVPMWSIIEHRGRRSGAVYRTPVSMFPTPDGVAILLAYGDDRDWVRNVLAAGGGRAVMGGKTFDVIRSADRADGGGGRRCWGRRGVRCSD